MFCTGLLSSMNMERKSQAHGQMHRGWHQRTLGWATCFENAMACTFKIIIWPIFMVFMKVMMSIFLLLLYLLIKSLSILFSRESIAVLEWVLHDCGDFFSILSVFHVALCAHGEHFDPFSPWNPQCHNTIQWWHCSISLIFQAQHVPSSVTIAL